MPPPPSPLPLTLVVCRYEQTENAQAWTVLLKMATYFKKRIDNVIKEKVLLLVLLLLMLLLVLLLALPLVLTLFRRGWRGGRRACWWSSGG